MAVFAIFRIRRDTAANWTSANPVLKLGEPGLETDTRQVKYGDGVTAWNALGYSKARAANANLAAIEGLTTVADKITYWTGAGAAAVADFTAFGRSFVGQTSALLAFDAIKQAASDTYAGVAELATVAEMEIGTDAGRVPPVSVLGRAWTAAAAVTPVTAPGGPFGSATASMRYRRDGRTFMAQGRATVTTLAPALSTDAVRIPLPPGVSPASDGSFSVFNSINLRPAIGRLIATANYIVIYDSVGLASGQNFDFTLLFER